MFAAQLHCRWKSCGMDALHNIISHSQINLTESVLTWCLHPHSSSVRAGCWETTAGAPGLWRAAWQNWYLLPLWLCLTLCTSPLWKVREWQRSSKFRAYDTHYSTINNLIPIIIKEGYEILSFGKFCLVTWDFIWHPDPNELNSLILFFCKYFCNL